MIILCLGGIWNIKEFSKNSHFEYEKKLFTKTTGSEYYF
jgi:hypothetical protein